MGAITCTWLSFGVHEITRRTLRSWVTEARRGKSIACAGHVRGAASPSEKVRPTAQVHAEAGWVLAPGAARVVPGASQLLRRRAVAEWRHRRALPRLLCSVVMEATDESWRGRALRLALALASTLALTQGLGLTARSLDTFFWLSGRGQPVDRQLVWSVLIRGGSSLAWGPACKAAASSQGSSPTGRVSSMREYYRAAVLSVCPGPASAFRIARRGLLCRHPLWTSLLKFVVSRQPPTHPPSSRLFHPSFFLHFSFPMLVNWERTSNPYLHATLWMLCGTRRFLKRFPTESCRNRERGINLQ